MHIKVNAERVYADREINDKSFEREREKGRER